MAKTGMADEGFNTWRRKNQNQSFTPNSNEPQSKATVNNDVTEPVVTEDIPNVEDTSVVKKEVDVDEIYIKPIGETISVETESETNPAVYSDFEEKIKPLVHTENNGRDIKKEFFMPSTDDEEEQSLNEPLNLEAQEEIHTISAQEGLDADLFGTTVERNDVLEDTETQVPVDKGVSSGVKAKEKVKFTPGGKTGDFKPPKLNKTMVMGILGGGIAIFLVLVNIAFQKAQEEKVEKQPDYVRNDGVLEVGDYKNKGYKPKEEEIVTKPETVVLKAPPKYTGKSTSTGSGVAVAKSPASSLTESDRQAMRAPLKKDITGYGKATAPTGGGLINTDSLGSMATMADEFVGSPVGSSLYGQSNPQLDSVANTLRSLNTAQSVTPDDALEASKNNGRFSKDGSFNAKNTRSGSINIIGDDSLFPGTIIHAVLVSGINTDYPADITARVIENVYDSKTGQNLLIPQGSIVKGNYSSSSIGISKVQIAWTDLVVNYNDVAYMVSLGGMAGVNAKGEAGIKGSLNDHYFQWLKAAGIMSMFSILNAEIVLQTNKLGSGGLSDAAKANQEIVTKIGDRLIERAMDIQPTVTVPNGTRVSISVNTPLQLVPFESIRPTQRYVRK